mmetsp:Transcript_30116/g.80878  ORF Transcript_30116/g.80878 Transcript_30116/m.80878 type:complete len:279 (-) Transcript_30116:889-1725(-)
MLRATAGRRALTVGSTRTTCQYQHPAWQQSQQAVREPDGGDRPATQEAGYPPPQVTVVPSASVHLTPAHATVRGSASSELGRGAVRGSGASVRCVARVAVGVARPCAVPVPLRLRAAAAPRPDDGDPCGREPCPSGAVARSRDSSPAEAPSSRPGGPAPPTASGPTPLPSLRAAHSRLRAVVVPFVGTSCGCSRGALGATGRRVRRVQKHQRPFSSQWLVVLVTRGDRAAWACPCALSARDSWLDLRRSVDEKVAVYCCTRSNFAAKFSSENESGRGS